MEQENRIREGGVGGMLSFMSALTGIEGGGAEKAKDLEGKSFESVNTYLFEDEGGDSVGGLNSK